MRREGPPPANDEVTKETRTQRSPGAHSVLVVDDNPATRRFVRDTLELGGYTVAEAQDGTSALQAFAETAADLLITDLHLRDMRGPELVTCLRRKGAPDLPVVLFTGAPDDLDELETAGPTLTYDCVLVKPADALSLLRVVGAHLRPRDDELAGLLDEATPPGGTAPGGGSDDVTLLDTLAAILAEAADSQRVFDEALARCLHAIGASRGGVYLLEAHGDFSLRSRIGDQDRVPGTRLADRETLFRRVVETGETVIIEKGPTPQRHGGRERPAERGGPTTVVAPVAAGTERLGVVVVEVPAHGDFRSFARFLELVGLGLGLAVGPRGAATPVDATRRGDAALDALTGLPDGVALNARLAEAVDSAIRLGCRGALLLVDVDRLRQVNNALGHHIGDAVLQGVASRLEGLVEQPVSVARVHSDVFGILMPGVTSPADATALARAVQTAFDEPVRSGPYSLYTTVSVGIALFPDHAGRAPAVLQRANSAVDVAKARGGSAVELYSAAGASCLRERLTVDQGLRAALERDELVLHYQPVVGLATGEPAGAEALLRWDRPAHGLTSAGEFMPHAEESGLIVPIGAWVLRNACAQAKRWRSTGWAAACVGVNVGARELHDVRLYETVRRTLETTGLDPTALCLEVTETVALIDLQHAVGVLGRLRGLGVQIALDDFGTGYSSLRYVQELPLDALKIDRLFVQSVSRRERSEPILAAIVNLAHELGLTVVAEGIENDEQLDLVRSLGCDQAQGYHLARPAPAERFRTSLP